jgi:Zn finger protein HypA/HybF involved in hydrogenase expression
VRSPFSAGGVATVAGMAEDTRAEPDLSTMCWNCDAPMAEEHAHYRCPECGWRDSCCDGPF